MAIIHDKHCHVVEHKMTGDSGMKNSGKSTAAVLGTNLEEAHMEVPATRRLTVTERSPDMEGRRTRRAPESSRPESRRLASTRKSVRVRSTTCPTVLTLERTKILSCCQMIFCRPDQCSRKSYVVDNSCLLMSSLPFIAQPTGESGSPDLYGRPRENTSTKNPILRN
jgi:hypothetical protein